MQIQEIWKHQFTQNLLELITSNSINHPDKNMRIFYRVLSKRFDKNDRYTKLLLTTLFSRDDGLLTPDHAVNLIARVTQWIWIEYHELLITILNGKFKSNKYEDKISLIAHLDEDSWNSLFDIFSNNYKTNNDKIITNISEEYFELIRSKTTQTTKPERYRTISLISNLIYKNKTPTLKIADIGSSIGSGLIALSNRSFTWDGIENNKKQTLNNINIKENSIAMDINIPDPKWVLACSYYFSKLDDYDNKASYYNDISNVLEQLPVNIIQGDLRNISVEHKELQNQFDIVSVLTTLYQLPDEDLERAINEVKQLLTNNGILIIADFINFNEDTGRLEKNSNWFSEKFSYKVYLLIKDNNGKFITRTTLAGLETEIIPFGEWDNGRCNKINTHEDSKQLLLELFK